MLVFQPPITTLPTLQHIVMLKMEYASVPQRTSSVLNWKFALRVEHAKVGITILSKYTVLHTIMKGIVHSCIKFVLNPMFLLCMNEFF